MKDLRNAFDVCVNIQMAQPHALGFSVLPLLKIIVAKSFTFGRQTAPIKRSMIARGANAARINARESRGRPDGFPNVLDPDQLDAFGNLQIRLLKKQPACDDRLDPGLLRRGLHAASAGRVIQIHGRPPGQRGRQIHQDAADARRQQDAHGVLIPPVTPQCASQGNGAGQRAQTGHAGSRHVRKRQSPRMAAHGSNKRVVQRRSRRDAVVPRLLTQFLNSPSYRGCRGG